MSCHAWFALAGIVYLAWGVETRGRSFEEIDAELAAGRARVQRPAPLRAAP